MTDLARGLWVGSLNVQSLSGKVGATAALATAVGVNVLAMQETMIGQDSFRSDARGATTAGVAFITDVPAQLMEIPEAMEFGGRVAAIKVARRQQRPLVVMSVYLPVVQWARGTGEDFVLLLEQRGGLFSFGRLFG